MTFHSRGFGLVVAIAGVVALAGPGIACAPPPTQPTVEIAPLPTTRTPNAGTSPSSLHRPNTRPSAGGPDRDGDGVLDDNDKCPDEPEDKDGFEDADGCPDPDNDQDGIADVQDQCPNDPGPAPTGCPHP